MEKEEKLVCSELVQTAKKIVSLNPTVDQVIVVQTEKSHIYDFMNHILRDGQYHGQMEDEKAFVQMLSDKEEVVRYIVCMWGDYSIDIPSMNFRKLLLAASEKNADAMLILKSEQSINLKKLSWSMPLGNVV